MIRVQATRPRVVRASPRLALATTIVAFLLSASTATAAVGPKQIKDIFLGGGDGNPDDIVALGSKVIFEATDATHGRELWKTDGTAAGTSLVKDATPGSAGSAIRNMVGADDLVYFVAYVPNAGYEVMRSDGTAAGTFMIKDIAAGTVDTSPEPAAGN